MKIMRWMTVGWLWITMSVFAEEPFWKPLQEPGCGGWVTSMEVSPHDSKRLLVGGDLLAIGLSRDGGEHWEITSGLRSPEVGDTTFHPTRPEVVFAGTMSGPYRSDDGGKTWVEKRNGFPKIAEYYYSAPIEKVVFDPRDPNHLFAFGGSSRRWGSPGKPLWGAIWESFDLGEHWEQAGSLEKNIVSAAISCDGKTLFAAVDKTGIFRSDDGGKTWTLRINGLPHGNVERVFTHPKNPDILWTSLGNHKPVEGKTCLPGGIFRSDDGGKTWVGIHHGLRLHTHSNENFTARFKGFAVSASNPDVMITSDSAWNGAVVYLTNDGGKNWKPVLRKGVSKEGVFTCETAYPSGMGLTVMSIDPKHPDHLYGAGAEYVVASFDGGKTWKDLTAQKVSETGAWKGRGYSGLCCTAFRFDPYHEHRSFFLAMDAGKVWESTDDRQTWTFRGAVPKLGPWGGGGDATFAKDGTVYVSTGQMGHSGGALRGVLGSDAMFTPLAGPKRGLPEYAHCQATGIYTLPDDSTNVWMVVNGTLYFSEDSGENWKPIFSDDRLGWIAADPQNPRTFYVSGKTNLWKTTDGFHFEPLQGPQAAGRLAVDSRGRVLLAAFRGQKKGLWRFDGKEWSQLHDDPRIFCVAVDPKRPTRLLIGGKDDPYHDVIQCNPPMLSDDDGKTWTPLSDGLPTWRCGALQFSPHEDGLILLGSSGSGFFYGKLP
ncbi:MAG: hypothetical protein Q4D98_02290 [Planctomycetia bacterium]|nr:hypothetical protein [Planctomycetia bacterium]